MEPSRWRRFRYRLAFRVAGTRDPPVRSIEKKWDRRPAFWRMCCEAYGRDVLSQGDEA